MIALTGIDFIIEKDVDDDTIATAVAAALAVSVEQVAVIGDIVEQPPKDAYEVVLLRHAIEGQFATLISLSCATRQIESAQFLARSVARHLRCSVLIPDDSTDDPDAMLLASNAGDVKLVQLDAEALNQERYCLLT